MTTLTIDRAKWYRGKGGKQSRLLIPSGEDAGKMCCLGFYSLSCGLTAEQIMDKPFPSDIPYPSQMGELEEEFPGELEWLLEDDDTAEAVELYIGSINDDEKLDDASREAQLIEQFAIHGIIPVFIN